MRPNKRFVATLIAFTTAFGLCPPAATSPAQALRGTKAPAGAWAQAAVLTGSDTAFSDYPNEASDFGWSVAVSGGTAVVGAPWFSSSTGFAGEPNEAPLGEATGRAYVFTKGPTGWRQTAELVGSDTTPGNEFGAAVAISGGTIVVGAPGHGPGTTFSDNSFYVGAGRAYVFQRDATGWHQTAELTTAGSYVSGCSVAVSGTTALVSAYSGAYVFQQSAAGWHRTAALERISVADAEGCYEIAVSGNTAAVGPSGEERLTMFSNSATGWHQTAQLNLTTKCVWFAKISCLNPDAGASIAISGDVLAVGAPGEWEEEHYATGQTITGGLHGRMYIFTKGTSSWRQTADLANSAFYFGWSVAASGNVIVAGAPAVTSVFGPGGFDMPTTMGHTYLFTRGPAGWHLSADLTGPDATPGDYSGRSVALSGGTVVVGAPYASRAFVFAG
jgi:hypothetical protein